jgi:hypothetical protein
MPSSYIGVVYDRRHKEIKAVINPDHDAQLDDPSWVHSDELGVKLRMLKIHRVQEGRGICPAVMSPADCHVAVLIAKERLGWS